jgi:hypothetical protein
MHIINSIPKDTAPGMDGNRIEFYKYCGGRFSAGIQPFR